MTAFIVAVAVGLGGAGGAHTTCTDHDLLAVYSGQWHAVRRARHDGSQGRNIRRWGLRSGRPSTCADLARSTRTLRGMRFRGAGLLSPSVPHVPPAGSATLRATGAPLAAIRACESGGNYGTETGNGFYGAYQFTQSTWASVGGSGDPAAASPAEQDKRAAMLYAREGSSPWPVCGR